MNARTASLADFINDVDNDFSIDDNFENCTLNVENVALDDNIRKQRVSIDTTSNTHGFRLIQLCKVLWLYIVNGRCGEDQNIGKMTCKNASVVDYAIVSIYLFRDITAFTVRYFDILLSDEHCLIALQYNFYKKIIQKYPVLIVKLAHIYLADLTGSLNVPAVLKRCCSTQIFQACIQC